jgi:hypothetical protein
MARDPLAVLQGRLDEVVDDVLDGLHKRVTHYAQRPRAELDDTIRPVARQAVDVFLTSLESERPPVPGELRLLQDSAAARAQEQVPLESVLGDYVIGAQVVWTAIHGAADGAPTDRLWELSHGMLAALEIIYSAVITAYLEEHRQVFGEHRHVRDALVDALVAGAPAVHLSERAGLSPLPGHLVVVSVALRLGATGEPPRRQHTRQLEAALLGRFGPQTLARLGADDGWILVDATAGPGPVVDDLRALVGALDEDRLHVLGGVAHGPPDDLAAAADLARELRVLAGRVGHASGLFDLDDLLLEHALAASSPSTLRLRSLLDPLDDTPDLLTTLAAWFASGFSRKGAAKTLHVHPNTLDYRLRRVAERLGLDLADPATISRVGCALVARRVWDASPGPPGAGSSSAPGL